MTVFIEKGDEPLSQAQAINRGRAIFDGELAQWQREAGLLTGDQAYVEWANQWLIDNQINEQNNRFNHQLAAVRSARARLTQYELSKGRPEIREMQETGEVDPETYEPILAEVVVQTEIEPLPQKVDGSDEDGNPVKIDNPLIVKDEAERDAAKYILSTMPEEVLNYDAS